MSHVRTALYLDFDNVFTGLLKLDPDVAMLFAQHPATWLERLTGSLTVDGFRRWLLLRCYMNPSGWVNHPTQPNPTQPKLFYSKFRPCFTNAGFEVIDCPRLSYTKNAADIRMVVDAVDALHDATRYDEFVVASGDSDMTPLLVRLRRADRRTTIVSPSDAAEAFTAVADRLIDGQRLLELVQGEPVDDDPETGPGSGGQTSADDHRAREQFGAIVARRYRDAAQPLNLAALAQEVRREIGSSVDDSDWFGAGGFVRALQRLRLPQAQFSQHFIWDESRHEAPDSSDANGTTDAPEPVVRLQTSLSLPRLPRTVWPAVYQALSEYARSHHFNLTEATRWSRDRLAERGVEVRRNAIGFVTRGASFGGCPLYREPTPTPAELGAAFVTNLLHRADDAGLEFTEEEAAEVRRWLAQPAAEPEPGRADPAEPPAPAAPTAAPTPTAPAPADPAPADPSPPP